MPPEPENRENPKRLQLSGAQLDYITGKGLDEYAYEEDADEVIEGVNETVSNLNLRLQYLVEDLSELHNRGYLDKSTREEILERNGIESEDSPIDIFQTIQEIERNDRLFDPPSVYNISTLDAELIRFGVHLGHIAHFININTEEEFQIPHVICGFIMGASGKWINKRTGISQSGPWLRKLEGSFSDSITNIEYARSSLIDSLDENSSEIGLNEEIEERLSEAGFEPVFPLVAEVYREVAPEVEDSASESHKIVTRAIKEIDLGETIWPVIADLKADDRIERVRTLADKIENDIEVLGKKSWRQEMCEIDVLAAFWLQNSILTDADTTTIDLLNKKYSKNSDQAVNKHLHDLEGDGKKPEPWDEYPLVQDRKNDEFTDYGELIAHLIVGEELHLEYPLLANEFLDELEVFSPEETSLVFVPDKEDILAGCYAFAFNHVQNHLDYRQLFESAYEERVNE